MRHPAFHSSINKRIAPPRLAELALVSGSRPARQKETSTYIGNCLLVKGDSETEDMSTRTIAEKLHLKENQRFLLLNEPKDYRSRLVSLPSGVAIDNKIPASGTYDIVQIFITSFRELETTLARLKSLLKANGALWVSYPKLSSKAASDIDRDKIAEFAVSKGLRPVALFAIDDTWSALRLKPI